MSVCKPFIHTANNTRTKWPDSYRPSLNLKAVFAFLGSVPLSIVLHVRNACVSFFMSTASYLRLPRIEVVNVTMFHFGQCVKLSFYKKAFRRSPKYTGSGGFDLSSYSLENVSLIIPGAQPKSRLQTARNSAHFDSKGVTVSSNQEQAVLFTRTNLYFITVNISVASVRAPEYRSIFETGLAQVTNSAFIVWFKTVKSLASTWEEEQLNPTQELCSNKSNQMRDCLLNSAQKHFVLVLFPLCTDRR